METRDDWFSLPNDCLSTRENTYNIYYRARVREDMIIKFCNHTDN